MDADEPNGFSNEGRILGVLDDFPPGKAFNGYVEGAILEVPSKGSAGTFNSIPQVWAPSG